MIVWGIAMLSWLHYTLFAALTGAFDFTKLDTEGPYTVGVKRVRLTDRNLEASVFYPSNEPFEEEDWVEWIPGDENTLIDAFQRVFKYVFKTNIYPKFLVRPFTRVKFPASDSISLAKEFSSGSHKIRPVVFSHGLQANANFYSGFCRAFAAQGYLVTSGLSVVYALMLYPAGRLVPLPL